MRTLIRGKLPNDSISVQLRGEEGAKQIEGAMAGFSVNPGKPGNSSLLVRKDMHFGSATPDPFVKIYWKTVVYAMLL